MLPTPLEIAHNKTGFRGMVSNCCDTVDCGDIDGGFVGRLGLDGSKHEETGWNPWSNSCVAKPPPSGSSPPEAHDIQCTLYNSIPLKQTARSLG